MSRRRRSPLRFLIPALIVGILLWWARVWPFRSSESPPPASSVATVGDAVQSAYEGLPASFRDKVPLEQFAGMFHRMIDPDRGSEVPQVRQATVADAAGPEHPTARFRVEYPAARVKAEYHFARVDGVWQLQSFTRVQGEWRGEEAEPEPRAATPVPPPRPREAEKAADPQPPRNTPAAPPASPTLSEPSGPRYYVVQPGDTLSGISRQFYGTTRYWQRILEANPGLTERRLRVGRRILIPSRPEPAPPKEAKEEPDPEANAAKQ